MRDSPGGCGCRMRRPLRRSRRRRVQSPRRPSTRCSVSSSSLPITPRFRYFFLFVSLQSFRVWLIGGNRVADWWLTLSAPFSNFQIPPAPFWLLLFFFFSFFFVISVPLNTKMFESFKNNGITKLTVSKFISQSM